MRLIIYRLAYMAALFIIVTLYSCQTDRPTVAVGLLPAVPQVEQAVRPVTPRPPQRGVTDSARPGRPAKRPQPSTTTTLPSWARCPQWWSVATANGWSTADMAHVDFLMWRESRCTPTARSTTRDTGLLQINDIHLSWLAAYGIDQQSLYDPAVNLRAGRLLFDQAQRMFGCGWQPWRTATFRPC